MGPERAGARREGSGQHGVDEAAGHVLGWRRWRGSGTRGERRFRFPRAGCQWTRGMPTGARMLAPFSLALRSLRERAATRATPPHDPSSTRTSS